MLDIPDAALRAAESAIRDQVLIRLGERALRDANAGRPIMLSGGEAEAAARAALEAALPWLGPKRQPRIVCPVCSREVVRRDDDTPRSHDVPVEKRALMCEDTFGRCRGGCRCRKCRRSTPKDT